MSPARLRVAQALVAAAILLTLEGVSRLVVPTGFPDPLIAGGHLDWSDTREYDPVLFWRMRPNAQRDGLVLTNRQGLRGPDVGAKAPDEFRILSLGESTTFAGNLPYEECYSHRLEGELGTVDGRRVRVINAGVPAYSLFQGVEYLKRRGLDFEPDAVMMYFGFNDFLPVADRVDRDAGADRVTAGMTDRELFAYRTRPRARVAHALQRGSNLVRWLSFRRAAPVERGSASAAPSGRPRVPERDRLVLLEDLRRVCRERGLRLIVVIPWYREFDRHVALLRTIRPEEAEVVVDLPARLPAGEARFFRDEVHPNASGHAEIARVVGETVRRAWKDVGDQPFGWQL